MSEKATFKIPTFAGMSQDLTYVIIPALNEEKSIAKVIGEIPMHMVKEVIVVDNGSTDETAEVARNAGATVLHCPERGYGAACLKGIEHVSSSQEDAIVAFMDGDHADYPEELPLLLDEIERGMDMVIGSRALGKRERGSLTLPQRFGNALACRLIRLFFGYHFTDLGPFRAIRLSALNTLGMIDRNYGWTAEMQVKAAKKKLKCSEVPVRYRNRIGESKVSGTVKGTVMAGYKILFTIFRYAF